MRDPARAPIVLARRRRDFVTCSQLPFLNTSPATMSFDKSCHMSIGGAHVTSTQAGLLQPT